MVAVRVYSSQTFSFGCKTLATKVAPKVSTPSRLSLDALRVRTLFLCYVCARDKGGLESAPFKKDTEYNCFL